jgi:hypothetical protein
MKKIILSIAFIAAGIVASAQVGVGTENPQTSLHVVGAGATDIGPTGNNVPGALTATDGITVPVVTNDMTLPVPGSLVAGTKVGQLVYSTFVGREGYYYWDGTAWATFGSAAGNSVITTSAVAPDYSGENIIVYTGGGSNFTLPDPANYTNQTINFVNAGTGTTTFITYIPNRSSCVLDRGIVLFSNGTSWFNAGGF